MSRSPAMSGKATATKSLKEKCSSSVQSARENGENEIGGPSTVTDMSKGEVSSSNYDLRERLDYQRPDRVTLPLPCMLSVRKCAELRIEELSRQELKLRAGQANDALCELQIGLADKAMLFHGDIRHVKSHAKKTCAWGKLHAMDLQVAWYAYIYRNCRKAMVALDAAEITLAKYQPLQDKDLKIAIAANDLNARGL